jgi:tetratricopeptide (TPR) repeat protein
MVASATQLLEALQGDGSPVPGDTRPRRASSSAAERPPGFMDAAAFDLVREIGKGGMATIYLARLREAPHRAVALKVIHPHLQGDPALVERFKHEVRAHVALKHPNIVEMIGWGEDPGGRLFMAMEFVDGVTLREALNAGSKRMPVELAVHVIARVVEGLGAAHARGVVHRDVKPANVMITRDGQVKVADFGIAKAVDMTQLTSTGNVVGTPAYMSPEQALARPLDARSDLFSAGIMLYELLLGQNPFQTGNPATTLSRVVHHQQRPVFETLPQTPAALEAVVDALLQKEAERRPADSAALLDMLDRVVREEGLHADAALLARFLAEPERVAGELHARSARRHFERGMKVYAAGKGSAEAALWDFFLATTLDPSFAEAKAWLEQVSSSRGYSLRRKVTPKIDELEARLKENPDELPVVLQLAKLHKAQGNFLQVIFYYKRAKALRPPDRYTQTQIETLVGAQAAPLIDGTGAFDAVPTLVAAAAARGAAPIPEASPPTGTRAEGWGDFLRGLASTTWAKVGLAACVLAACIVGVGTLLDRAAQASQGQGARHAPPVADVPLERAAEMLVQARAHASKKRHEKAEDVLRRLLDEERGSSVDSEARFLLGDALERQARRPEAMQVHLENTQAHADDWAARSHGRRAEMMLLESDTAGARAEYEAMARVGTGDTRLEAMVALAGIMRSEGRLQAARDEYEALLPEARGTGRHDEVRLALASIREESGDHVGAARLYAEIRDTSDARSGAFRTAVDGYARVADAAGVDALEAPAETETYVPLDETFEPVVDPGTDSEGSDSVSED